MIRNGIYIAEPLTVDGLPTLKIGRVDRFDVTKTFDCGQCFGFEPVAGSRHAEEFAGTAHGRFVSFALDGSTLYIYNATPEDFDRIWYRFLGLDTDYASIDADILARSSNPALREAVEMGRGIRILRQEEWETLCSFIISQNNNIPRIKKLVYSLCREYGEKIDVPDGMAKHGAVRAAYSFPTPDVVADAGIDAIFSLKTGFRAKYIIDAAKKCASGELDLAALASEDTRTASERLKSVKGVGDKVAACSLLFGFGHLDAFPVDVWVKRVISKYFGEGFDAESLGPYAGVAQQYLFYYERWLGGAPAARSREQKS